MSPEEGILVKRLEFPGGKSFSLVINNILNEPVDCIVNAANGFLSHGGGVAAAIAKAAGPELIKESEETVRKRGEIPTGEAVVTTAGRLPFKGVIHTVGPRMGMGDEESRLVKALKSAFIIAHEKGWASLSFPAVSSGIYAVPYEICARAYIKAVKEFFREYPDTPLKTIRLSLFQGPLVEVVKKEMEGAEKSL